MIDLTKMTPAQVRVALKKVGVQDETINSLLADDPEDRVIQKSSTKAKKKKLPKLGSGARFAKLESSIARRGGARDPGAVAAAIGRKKYGASRFAKLAAHGKKEVMDGDMMPMMKKMSAEMKKKKKKMMAEMKAVKPKPEAKKGKVSYTTMPLMARMMRQKQMMEAKKKKTTTKAARDPRKIKRDRLGRFAHVAGAAALGAAEGLGHGYALSHLGTGRALGVSLGATLLGAMAQGEVQRSAMRGMRGPRKRLARQRTKRTLTRAAGIGQTAATLGYLGVHYGPRIVRAIGRGRARRKWTSGQHPSGYGTGPVIAGKYKFSEFGWQVNTKAKLNGKSYDEIQMEVRQEFRNQFPESPVGPYRYVSEVYPDFVIVSEGNDYYKVGYSDEGFDPMNDWQAVERQVSWETKEVPASAFVFKDANDEHRWVLLSSNGYRDRDGELIETKALERDVALWELSGQPADPLRWWHVALDEDFKEGLELGQVDFRMVHDHTLIESGTFIDPVIGEAVFKARDRLAASVGFRHSLSQPNSDKIFDAVQIFERSLLPKENASNPLTHLAVLGGE